MTSTARPPLDRTARKGFLFVIAYPFALVAICLVVNALAFDVEPLQVSLPSAAVVGALALAGTMLAINHSWLMTTTELVRVRYKIFATPEEWAAAGRSPSEVTAEGQRELGRHHNAHRNATENTVHFVLLAVAFALSSPSSAAAYTWILGFAVARLGHAAAYMTGRDGLRGLFMTLGLLGMYGLATHLMLALI